MKFLVTLLAACLTLSGCGTAPPQPPLFVDAAVTTLAPPPADKAQIVFLMPKNLFVSTVAVELYDVRASDSTLMAMVPSFGKTVQLVEPGHHQFMTHFGAAGSHIMDADVVAGKRYYVLMRFIYGFGFQLRPIRAAGASDYSVQNKDFASWSSSTHFVDKTAAGDAWYATNKPGIDTATKAAIAAFNQKTAEQRAELTLNAADAIAQ